MRVFINGRQLEVNETKTILQLAKEAGIEIPTLCHHEGLTPYGACRLCIVEIRNGASRAIDTACTRTIEDGMEITTDSQTIQEQRRIIAELHLAKSPDATEVKETCQKLGVSDTRYTLRYSDCILCGKCTRACKEELGVSAISFAGRGYDREVDTPFSLNAEACIGCGACADVCPTGAIQVEDEGATRYIRYFNTALKLQQCGNCGEYFSPEKMTERLKRDLPSVPSEHFDLCESCRRKQQMKNFVESENEAGCFR